jgi:predicted transcriptional regulator
MAVPLILKRVATGVFIRKAISKDVQKADIPQNEVNKIKRGLNEFAKGIVVKTNSNSKEVIRKIDKFENILSKAIDKGIKQAGFQLLDIIRTKTQKGIDFQNKPFAPYSEGYLKKLEKEGKPTNVDLWYTGKMLGSLTPSEAIKKTGKYKITLGFARAEERNKALWNQVLGTPKREFFGFNSTTEKIINKQFNRFIEKELKKARI